MPDMLQTPDTVQISEILKRLKKSDPTLTAIAMNNYKDVESVLIDIARLLKKNIHVKKLSVANTQMKPAVCLVRLNKDRLNHSPIREFKLCVSRQPQKAGPNSRCRIFVYMYSCTCANDFFIFLQQLRT